MEALVAFSLRVKPLLLPLIATEKSLGSYTLLFCAPETLFSLKGHVQTIFGKINVIVTLRAGPPLPPPLNVMDFFSYKILIPIH